MHFDHLDATDPDTPKSLLAYTISPPYLPDAGVAFFVNVIHNGTVGISAIDAEIYSSITFGVSVTDGIHKDTAVVVVNVTDVNDNDPVLVLQSSVNVMENAQPGQDVLTVSATDKDISNSGFTFYIETGTDGKFQLHPSTGVITTAGQFDRRQKTVYNFSVNVIDHGSPSRAASQLLVVNIVDSNTAPVFVNNMTTRFPVANYSFNVPEDTPVGSQIGPLYAYDPDFGSSGQLKYEITFQDPKDFFSLGNTDGLLKLNKMLNYEMKNKYLLIAIVSDNSYQSKTATATVDISVQNIIEAPDWPLPLPAIYFTQTSTCSPQLQAVSQEVITLSSRGDEDVEYQLLNNSNLFRINITTGDLQVITSLTTGTYFVGLAACAKGTPVCSNATLTIVASTGDSLMFCPSFVNIMVNESTYLNKILQDLDTNKGDSGVQYSITSGNSDKIFWINSTNGKLYANGPLDRESTYQYILTVTATQATSKETAQAQIIINVLDLPDTAPVFQLNMYSGEVSESDNVGGPVKLPESSIPLRVQASDQDLNPVLTYSIDSASDTSYGSFSVDSSTGAIYLAKKIDFETMPTNLNRIYSFNVTVTDSVFKATTQVQVKILDANDNVPVFVDPMPTVITISEDKRPPEVIGTVIATDADSIDYGKLKYKIKSVLPSGRGNPFKIEAETGDIVLDDRLDRETIESYVLTITVEDLAGHNATKQVHINVLDVNDNGPYFLNTTYFMNVTEEILSANTFTPETVAKYVDLQSGFVYKSMHDDVAMTSFVALLIMYPSQENTFYTCDAHTLDVNDMPEKFTTGIEVISKGQLSISELLKELQILGNKLFSLTMNGSVTHDEHCVKATEHITEENTMYREMLYHISDPFQNTRFYLSKASDCGNSYMAASKANQMCETMGGHLARIENSQQYTFIQNFLKSKINYETSVLISGHDEERHDHWVYHGSDQPLHFVDWAISEPDGHNVDGRHCIVMGWSGIDLKMLTNYCAENSVTRYTTYMCAIHDN
ncbi:hypothetical protein Btru_059135 [Bulinus truncatus]|nr:hypothetical protein Btru_059135 [Bulinus truncatus]